MLKSATLKFRTDLVFPLLIAVFLSLYFYDGDEGKYSVAGLFNFMNIFFLFGVQRPNQIGLGRPKISKETIFIGSKHGFGDCFAWIFIYVFHNHFVKNHP